MLKSLALIFSLIIFVSCGGSGEKSGVKVSLGFSFTGEVLNKAMLSGVNRDTKERFSRKLEVKDFDLELSNGNWELYLTYWETPEYFAAATLCRVKSVNLTGEEVELNFDISTPGCSDYSKLYDSDNNKFFPTRLIACNSSPAVTTPTGQECDGDKDSSIASYKVEFKSFKQDTGSDFIKFGMGLEVCLEANTNVGEAYTYENTNNDLVNFLPMYHSNFNPFIIHITTYSEPSCVAKSGYFEFNEGLQNKSKMNTSDTFWAHSSTNKQNYLYLISGNSLPPPTDPTTVPGLVLWLDGADPSTMFSSTDCVSNPVTTNGDPVKCWKDKAANGHNATEAINYPIYKQGALNGLSGLAFNDQLLNISDHTELDTGSAITYYIVFKETTKETVTRSLMEKKSGSFRTLQLYLANTDKVFNFTDDGTSVSKSGEATASAVGAPKIIAVQITNAGGQVMLKDGLEDSTSLNVVSFPSSASTVIDTAGDLVIGNTTGGGSSGDLNGDILEVLYFNTQLSADDKAFIDSYLKAKWNL